MTLSVILLDGGFYYNRHLRNAFIEDLVFFDEDSGQYAPCIL